ncbi:MAG: caspase family protein [Candidatus Melainabacteria bacterium]|nr:MAG: caspase family protein [Candidatus Melainabacteria bacterium]
MKKVKFLLALLTVSGLFGSTAQAQTPPKPTIHDKWAMIVGIDNYQDTLLNTNKRVENARKFLNFLTASAGFKPDHCFVFLEKEASRRNVMASLGATVLPQCVQNDDLLIIYFSTSTSPSSVDPQGLNFILFQDSLFSNAYSTGLKMQSLTNTIQSRVHCKNVVIILDGEFSQNALLSSESSRENDFFRGREERSKPMIICSGNLTKNGKFNNNEFTDRLITAFKSKGQNTTISEALIHLKNPEAHGNKVALDSTLSISSPAAYPRNCRPR